MDKHKNEISELRLWAKDDIVPGDLQDLCKIAAASIKHLQAEVESLKEKLSEEYSRGVRDGLNQASDIVKGRHNER